MTTTTKTTYCRPSNAGLQSETGAVARRLGKLVDALDNLITRWVVNDDSRILGDIERLRSAIRDGLEAEGWIVGYTDGTLEPAGKCKVYPPGSPTGEKIRKWRASR